MDLLVDTLLLQIKHKLRNFKRIRDIYNFSCPFCGDSKKNKLKARAYIYPFSPGEYNFHCKNCGKGSSVKNFLKEISPESYHSLLIHSFISPQQHELVTQRDKVESVILPKELIPYYNIELSKRFIAARKIPEQRLIDVYYIEDLNELINNYTYLGYSPLKYESPRLVFVIRNEDREIIGYVTRAIYKKDPMRYYNISITKEPLLYGINRLDNTKPIWIVEGIIDSLFLENSIASCSSSFQPAVDFCNRKNYKQYTLVYDNEPYNQQICNNIKHSIESGHEVVIYNQFPFKGKDINEMILKNGIGGKEVQAELSRHAFQGIRAQLEYFYWLNGN